MPVNWAFRLRRESRRAFLLCRVRLLFIAQLFLQSVQSISVQRARRIFLLHAKECPPLHRRLPSIDYFRGRSLTNEISF